MKHLIRIADVLHEVEVEPEQGGGFTLTLGDKRYRVELRAQSEQSHFTLLVDSVSYPLYAEHAYSGSTIIVDGAQFVAELVPHAAAVLAEVRAQHPLERHGTFPVKAPMPGLVKEVFVQQGEKVAKGQRLLVLEAMKMNNEIRSPQDGIVKALPIVRDQRVNMGDLLVLLE